jgi:hypothetical protein
MIVSPRHLMRRFWKPGARVIEDASSTRSAVLNQADAERAAALRAELAEIDAKLDAIPTWGAAVSVLYERRRGIVSALSAIEIGATP